MKLSVFFDHILQAQEQSGESLMTLLSYTKKSGIDAVEIRLTYLLEHEETAELLKKAGLAISCIYEFYEMDSRDEKTLIEKHVKTAARFHTGRILVVPGFFTEKEAEEMMTYLSDYEQVSAYMENNPKALGMAKGLQEAVLFGEKESVIVTVEDFDDIRSPLFCINGIRWFMERIPGLRYTFDTGNFIYSKEQAADALAAMQGRVAHVHCKDRGKHFSSAAVGDGMMPIAELIRMLKESGYDGYLAIEHFDAPDQAEKIKRSAEFLKKQLAVRYGNIFRKRTCESEFKNVSKEVKGGDYLSLALCAFAGLGVEVIYAYLLEPVLYGVPMQEFSAAQTILHWIITCTTWGLAHIFTKNLLTGILGIILGFAMGSVYLLVNRNFKKAYIFLFLMFIL